VRLVIYSILLVVFLQFLLASFGTQTLDINLCIHLPINLDFFPGMLDFCDLWLVQAATLKIVLGSHIWLEDKDLAWIDGEVFRIEGQKAHIRTTNGNMVFVADIRYYLFSFAP
jgi:hypothetical protein